VDEADLPTPKTILEARYVRSLLTCWYCRHQADAAHLPQRADRHDLHQPRRDGRGVRDEARWADG
jgi:hypothetical protein